MTVNPQTDQSRPVSRVSVVEALTQIRALCDQIDNDISLQGSRDEGLVGVVMARGPYMPDPPTRIRLDLARASVRLFDKAAR